MGYRTPFRFAQQSSGSSLPIVNKICKQNNWSINTKFVNKNQDGSDRFFAILPSLIAEITS